MRILLVNPGYLDDQGRPLRMAREVTFGITLPYLAALIPERHSVRIVEDSMEEIDYNAPVDAVMISAVTSRADRAYQIAAEFRKRKKKVVLGGIHASILPEEALEHVDAVVVGEAEGVMEELLADLEAGRLQDKYQAPGYCDLAGLPPPRYELMNRRHYLTWCDPLQVSRGCPYRCKFCTVTRVMGTRHRKRPIGDVLRDLEAAARFLYIVDDNFFADRDYSLELMRAMKGRGKWWLAQANLKIAFDPELLQAAREAGLITLYIGIETMDRAALKTMSKQVNLELDCGEALDRLRRAGVTIMGSVMVGFDSDTPERLDELVEFLIRHKTPILFPYILTPFPGTELRQEMEAAGRLLKVPWFFYDGSHTTFQPRNMGPAQLEAEFWRFLAKFYSIPSIVKRFWFPPRFTPTLFNYMCRNKVRGHFHPWFGELEEPFLSRLEPLLTWLMSSDRARRWLSALERKG